MIASCSVELRERAAQNIVLTEAWNKLAWTLFESIWFLGDFSAVIKKFEFTDFENFRVCSDACCSIRKWSYIKLCLMMSVSSWAVDQNESIRPKHPLYKAKMAKMLCQIPRNAYVQQYPGRCVRLRHGNPSIWPACAALALVVPKILEKFVFSTKLSTLTFSEPSVNAVDVVRAIAIWNSTFASFQSFSTQKLQVGIREGHKV